MLLPTALLNPPQTPSAAPIMPESATKIERINLKTKCWCKKISRPAIAKRLIIILFLTAVIARSVATWQSQILILTHRKGGF